MVGYSFSQTTSTYTNLTGGTVLATGSGLDTQRYAIALPFTFSFNDKSYTNLYVSVNGYITLGTKNPGPGYGMINSQDTGFGVISAFDANLASHPVQTSEISYAIQGNAPNRVLVVQWSRMGLSGSSNLDASFQVRLREAGGISEITYGNVLLTNNDLAGGVFVGLRGDNRQDFTSRTSSTATAAWQYTIPSTQPAYTIAYFAGFNPAPGLKYTFTPPPPCPVPPSLTNLSLSPNQNSVDGWFNVPGWTTGHLVIASYGAPLNTVPVNGTVYSVGSAIGNGVVVALTNSNTFTHNNLPPNTPVTYTVYSYNASSCQGTPTYSTTGLTGSTETKGARTYYWQPVSGSANYTLPGNWQPVRTYIDAMDTLVFGNGGNFTVTNIPASSAIQKVVVRNQTTVKWQSVPTCIVNIGDSLNVETGSQFTLSENTSSFKVKLFNTNSRASIKGILCLTGYSVFDALNGRAIISGTLVDSGLTDYAYLSNNNTSLLDSGGTYLFAKDGGYLAQMQYDTNSNTILKGLTNYGVYNTNPIDFGNLEWNCPAQAVDVQLMFTANVKGNFTITNSNNKLIDLKWPCTVSGQLIQNSGKLKIQGLTTKGNVTLNAGTLDFNPTNGNLNLEKNLFQAAAHTINPLAVASWTFNGNALQQLTLNGTLDTTARISYVLNNMAGVQLNTPLYVANNAAMTMTAGQWSGTGNITYGALNSQLVYNPLKARTITDKEWPVTNGPASLTLRLLGANPQNRLTLSGHRTLGGTLIIDYGVLVLNQYNLTANQVVCPAGSPAAMVAADSTGELLLRFATGNSNKVFPVGNLMPTPQYAQAELWLRNNNTARTIGVRVKATRHPANNSTTSYLNRYWLLTDNQPAAGVDYDLSLAHQVSDLSGTNAYTMAHWNGLSWTPVASVTQYYNSGAYGAALRNTTGLNSAVLPLNNAAFTGLEMTAQVYSWTGYVNQDYTQAGNWTPARTAPYPADVLQFNSGHSDTVTNIPTQYIGRLKISNGTAVSLQAGSAAASTLYIGNDLDTTTAELQVDAGSSLYLNGTQGSLTVQFVNLNLKSRAQIAGRIEAITYPQAYRELNFGNTIATVALGGVLLSGGNGPGGINGTTAGMLVYGQFIHRFETGGTAPTFSWMPGSRLVIGGITTGGSLMLPGNMIRSLEYNCPAQTGAVTLVNGTVNITDTFMMASSGSSFFRLGTTPALDFGVKEYRQTGGQLDLSSGSGIFQQVMKVTGHFIQTGGQLLVSGTINNTNTPELHFAGTNGLQQAQFSNAAPAGPLMYRFSNPAGVQLSGAGSFGTDFNLNTKGGIRIATTNAWPVQTNLKLVYMAGSILTYDAAGDCTTDSIVFPAQNGPSQLVIAMPAGKAVSIPFDRTIPNLLRMAGGNISLGNHVLTLGSSGTVPGTLSWTSGLINVNGGAFKRWFSTSAVPLSVNDQAGYFPVGTNGVNRAVNLYFNTSTALSSGGTLAVTHSPASGITSGLNMPDGVATIASRTNASWTFNSGNGLAVNGTGASVKVAASQLFTAGNPAQLHFTQAAAAPGAHITAVGAFPDYSLQRSNLSTADLNNTTFYGSMENPGGKVFISVVTGNWNNAATWDLNAVPGAGDMAIIAGGTTVTTAGNGRAAHIVVNATGTLLHASGSLLVDSSIDNMGSMSTTGTLTLGPSGGGNARFTNTGNFTLGAGTVSVNGSMDNTISSSFTQTGGNLVIDGNRNGMAAQSVSGNMLSFNSPSLTLSGGSIRIVDPHAVTTSAAVLSVGISQTTVRADTAHTFYLGDGVSVNTGSWNLSFTNTQGAGLAIGQLIVQGTSAQLTGRTPYIIRAIVGGDIKLTNGAELTANLLIAEGNIQLDSGTSLVATNVSFSRQWPVAGYYPQQITGSGKLNLGNWSISNNTGGVQTHIGDVTAGSVNFISGKLDVGAGNTLFVDYNTGITGASATRGWVLGKLHYKFVNSSSLNLFFPLGDDYFYTPVSLWGSSASTATGGVSGAIYPIDHPSIYSSPILPNKSISRYFELGIDSSYTFLSGTGNLSLIWDENDEDTGMVHSDIKAAVLRGQDWTALNNVDVSGDTLTILDMPGKIRGSYQLGQLNPQLPKIRQQPKDSLICMGSSAAFKVALQNSNGYQYRWQQLTDTGWNALSNAAPYSGVQDSVLLVTLPDTSLNGTLFRCMLLTTVDTIYSGIATMKVLHFDNPAVAIHSLSPGDSICGTSDISFVADVTNGGAAPVVTWKKNGVTIAGKKGINVYLSNIANNDTISCEVLSNAPCLTNPVVTSNQVVVHSMPFGTPLVSISASPGNAVCSGASITLTANGVYAGNNPVYTWYQGGSPVGNGSVFTIPSVTTSSNVYCSMTSNYKCRSGNSATSNTLYITPAAPVTPSISISSAQGTTVCSNSNVSFTAYGTNVGLTPVYQWRINGVNTGNNSATFMTSALNNNDTVTCVLTSAMPCVTVNNVVSNAITMTVQPSITPAVSILASDTNICAGAIVTLTSTVTAGQGNPVSYYWRSSGMLLGTNPTLVTNTLTNNEEVSLEIYSTGTCFTSNTALSNMVKFKVTSPVTTVQTQVSPGRVICGSNPVTYTAVVTNGSPNMSWSWYKNGLSTGISTASYTDNTPANNDKVFCMLYINNPCGIRHVYSDTVNLTVNQPGQPVVTITVTPGHIAGTGVPVTFTATSNLPGNLPVYRWMKNGQDQGVAGDTYTTSNLISGDIIQTELTSSDPCAVPPTAVSNQIIMTITTGLTDRNNAFKDIRIYPNPNKGSFSIKGSLPSGVNVSEAAIQLFSALGQQVYSSTMPIKDKSFEQRFDLPDNILPGVYLLKMQFGDQVITGYITMVR